MDNKLNTKRKSQSISRFSTSPIQSMSDFIAVIKREVATAFYGQFRQQQQSWNNKETTTGTYKACQQPDASTFQNNQRIVVETLAFSSSQCTHFTRIMEIDAKSIINAKKTMIPMSLVIINSLIRKRFSGMAGVKYLRVT